MTSTPQAPGPVRPDDDASIDDSRHLRAVLFTLRKAHAELFGFAAAHAQVREILTKGDARRYAAELLPQLRAERSRRRALRKHGQRKD